MGSHKGSPKWLGRHLALPKTQKRRKTNISFPNIKHQIYSMNNNENLAFICPFDWKFKILTCNILKIERKHCFHHQSTYYELKIFQFASLGYNAKILVTKLSVPVKIRHCEDVLAVWELNKPGIFFVLSTEEYICNFKCVVIFHAHGTNALFAHQTATYVMAWQDFSAYHVTSRSVAYFMTALVTLVMPTFPRARITTWRA